MTAPIPTFAQYVASLGRLTPHVDPTLITPESEQIRAAAPSLVDLAEISRASLAAKGFDSTGSKLTDAVREVEEMVDVRLPTQLIMVGYTTAAVRLD